MSKIDDILDHELYVITNMAKKYKSHIKNQHRDKIKQQLYEAMQEVIGEYDKPLDIPKMDRNMEIFINNRSAFYNKLRQIQRQKLDKLFGVEK